MLIPNNDPQSLLRSERITSAAVLPQCGPSLIGSTAEAT